MMGEYAVYMTSAAHRDLAEIVQYIAEELAEPITATKQVDRLENAIASLAVMPSRVSPVADELLAAMGLKAARRQLLGLLRRVRVRSSHSSQNPAR